uniref:Antistasin-like factor D n=1 Tax=Hirudo verbana TaxID=311461 RepID=A0A7T0KAY1_9ANNE|nr:antistasin-like factor D [Hirudo verbana]
MKFWTNFRVTFTSILGILFVCEILSYEVIYVDDPCEDSDCEDGNKCSPVTNECDCSPVRCRMQCNFYVKDSNGCETCACEPICKHKNCPTGHHCNKLTNKCELKKQRRMG